MQVQIPWNTGGGNITVSYDKGHGDDTLLVSSSDNTSGTDRQQTIYITSTKDSSKRAALLVKQTGGVIEGTFTGNPSAFVSGSYQSISNQNNPVGKSETATTYAEVNLTTGNNAITQAFWKFDCSSIPSGAEILSVSCVAKAMCNANNTKRVEVMEMQMYKGTSTAKGSAASMTTTAASHTISCGSWTRAELDDINIRMYAKRGTQQATTTYYIRFYGATLTIKYRYQGLTLTIQQNV